MSSRYSRNISPPGRRNIPPERASTGHVGYPNHDQHYSRDNRDNYTSPRSSAERVIPISSETFFNGVPVTNSRIQASYDQYSDYGRRPNTLGSDELQRQNSLNSSSTRSRSNIIQSAADQTYSSRAKSKYDKDYYVTTATSNSPRKEHRKIYSVDDGKPARLVEDYDKAGKDQGSLERYPNRDSRNYYMIRHPKNTNVDESGGYEYTDARGMFRDTEPRWRSRRRGSVDAADRVRPSSMVDSNFRIDNHDISRPPATKGLGRIINGIARHGSLRDDARAGHNDRDRDHEYYSQDDTYEVRPRVVPGHGELSHHNRLDIYSPPRDNSDTLREPKRPNRKFEDHDVASRGFGIRAPSIEPSPSHDEALDRRSGYSNESLYSPTTRRDYTSEKQRADHRSHLEGADRERYMEWDRDLPKDKTKSAANRDKEVEADVYSEGKKNRTRGNENLGNHDDSTLGEERRTRDQRTDAAYDSEGLEKSRDSRRGDQSDEKSDQGDGPIDSGTIMATAVGAGAAAAYGIGQAKEKYEKERYHGNDAPSVKRRGEMYDSADEGSTRERHYVRKDDYSYADSWQSASKQDSTHNSLNPDEEYRRRIQKEVERSKSSRQDNPYSLRAEQDDPLNGSPRPDKHLDENKRVGESQENSKNQDARGKYGNREDSSHNNDYDDNDFDESKTSRTSSRIKDRHDSILDEPLTDEPAQVIESRENRVRIVEPPKEKDMPKGILRKPTERFPEDPNPVREGVAPLKDATKKGVPAGARWTKIDRKLVNPEALEEAKERFEERQDCVIVLRVLTREEIQKFADRTREIREDRYEQDHNDRRHYYNKDKSRREYDGTSDDSEGDTERDKPRQIGWH